MSDPDQRPGRASPGRRVATGPTAKHPALRGRAYPVRFGTVWEAALRAVESLRGWSLVGTDAKGGEIRAVAIGRVWKRPDEISVLVSLDEHGLTRVDLAASPLTRRFGRGASRRRIAAFLRALDASI